MRSFSIDDFCLRQGISRAFYYKLALQGKGPRTFDIGRIRRISEVAEAEWIAALEAAPVENAKRKEVAHKGVAARRAKAAAAAAA